MILMADSIASGYAEITNQTGKSKLSVSKPRFNRKTKYFRAVGSEFIGSQIKEKKLLLRANYPIVLRCDVKNYYRAIYTHSIPWAIYGKQYAKRHTREKILGNELDQFIRVGQDGQTIGIPVGPDSSFILGELILSAVDKELGFDQRKAIRFYDDYEFGCKSEIEAENILDRLENLLSNFELELNHEKTRLVKGPSELEGYWTQIIKDFTERKRIRNNEDLIDIFNLASRLALDNESDFVFKYFIRRMRMTVLNKDRWDTWQNILLSSAFSEFGNLREIYEQLDLYGRIGYSVNCKSLYNLLVAKAEAELRGSSSSELSWLLFGFLKFNIKPPKELIIKVIDTGDDISRIIAIKLAIVNKIGIKIKLKELMTLLDADIGVSEHWLLFWELYINGWIEDVILRDEILKEGIFEFLSSKNVSFLRSPQIDLLEIPAPFKKRIEEISGAEEFERLNRAIKSTFHDLSSEEGGDSDIDEGPDYF